MRERTSHSWTICLKDKSAEIPQVKPNGGSFRSFFFHHKEPHSKPGQLKLIGRIETCLGLSSPVCSRCPNSGCYIPMIFPSHVLNPRACLPSKSSAEGTPKSTGEAPFSPYFQWHFKGILPHKVVPPQSCERWLINPIKYRFQQLFWGVSVHVNSTNTILHAIRLSDPGSSFQVPRQSRSPCSRTPALEASASTAPGSVRPSSKNAWRGAEFQVTPTMGGLTWLNQGNMEMSLRFWDGIDGSNSEEFTHKIGFL